MRKPPFPGSPFTLVIVVGWSGVPETAIQLRRRW